MMITEEICPDPVVRRVLNSYLDRSAKGMATYGVTMAGNKLHALSWLQHALEECQDMSLYLERLRAEIAEQYAGERLTVDAYQDQAVQTAIYDQKFAVMYPALGLAGEAGEVANKIKKVYRDKGGVLSDEDRKAIAAELGDVAWYLAALARDLNIPLSEAMQGNLDKLADRQARGKIGGSGDNR